MSVKVMGWVWDQDLPQNEKFVLLAHADHADHDGYNIFPSIDLIAHKTGYSRRSVQRIIKKLVEKGYLIPIGLGPNATNKYKIPIPMGGDRLASPGVTPAAEGVTPTSPEPSVNRHDKPLTPPPPKGKGRTPVTADDIMLMVAIPDKFGINPEFSSTWYAFLEHRIEIKKPMTTRGAIMMLKKLGKHDVVVAIVALQDSVANGWQGVFPEKNNSGAPRNSAVSRQVQAREDMDNYLRRDLEQHIDIGGMHE